ncbi:MAG: metallophosphoesterase, partial [Erysipelotrichales bacterium]|nr:metallophosphoesterase [Erysipelotrichales bacterium]
MGVKIVHLSDIHFSEINKDEHFSKLEPLITQIENLGNKKENLIILVSGDIAYSGDKEEYKEASRFFRKLRSDTNKFFLNAYIYFVPGNHDCNLGEDEYATERRKVIDELINNRTLPTNENIRYISKPLSNYFNFSRIVSSYVNKKSLLHHTQTIDLGYLVLNINLINTAWMSTLHESKTLLMPKEFFDFSTKSSNSSKKILNIFVYHHPRSWFVSEDDHIFR